MSNQPLLNSLPIYPPHLARRRFWCLFVAIGGMTLAPLISGAQEKPPVVAPAPDFYFIDSSIENGSPLHWDIMPDGTILISLQYPS